MSVRAQQTTEASDTASAAAADAAAAAPTPPAPLTGSAEEIEETVRSTAIGTTRGREDRVNYSNKNSNGIRSGDNARAGRTRNSQTDPN